MVQTTQGSTKKGIMKNCEGEGWVQIRARAGIRLGLKIISVSVNVLCSPLSFLAVFCMTPFWMFVFVLYDRLNAFDPWFHLQLEKVNDWQHNVKIISNKMWLVITVLDKES